MCGTEVSVSLTGLTVAAQVAEAEAKAEAVAVAVEVKVEVGVADVRPEWNWRRRILSERLVIQ